MNRLTRSRSPWVGATLAAVVLAACSSATSTEDSARIDAAGVDPGQVRDDAGTAPGTDGGGIAEPPTESVRSVFDGFRGSAFDDAARLKSMSLAEMGFTYSLYCDSSPQVPADPACTGDGLLLNPTNPRHYRIYTGDFGTGSGAAPGPSLNEYSYTMATKSSLLARRQDAWLHRPEDFAPPDQWVWRTVPLRHRMALVVPKAPVLTPAGKLPVVVVNIHIWSMTTSTSLVRAMLALVRDYGVAVVMTSNMAENYSQLGYVSQDDIMWSSLFAAQKLAAGQSQNGLTFREVARRSYLYALVRADVLHQTAVHRFFEPGRTCGSAPCNPSSGAPLAVAAAGGSKEGYAHWMLGALDDRISVLAPAGMPFEDFSSLRKYQQEWASWSINPQKSGCYPWNVPDFPALQSPDLLGDYGVLAQVFGEWMDNAALPGAVAIRQMLEPKRQIALGLLPPSLEVIAAGDTGTITRLDAGGNVTDDPTVPREAWHDSGFPSPLVETPFWSQYGGNPRWRYLRQVGTREARAINKWQDSGGVTPTGREHLRQVARALLSTPASPKVRSVTLSGQSIAVKIDNPAARPVEVFVAWAASATRNWVVPQETGNFPYDYSWQWLALQPCGDSSSFCASVSLPPSVQLAYLAMLRSSTTLGGVADWDWDSSPVQVVNPVAPPPVVTCYSDP